MTDFGVHMISPWATWKEPEFPSALPDSQPFAAVPSCADLGTSEFEARTAHLSRRAPNRAVFETLQDLGTFLGVGPDFRGVIGKAGPVTDFQGPLSLTLCLFIKAACGLG